MIASSGNDGTESVDYPAAYDDYVIAVGATRYDETRASYSDYGSSLDLVAPGGDVYADQNEDGYGDGVLQQTFKPYETFVVKADPTDWGYWFFDGTSMAAPHVSGVAALLLAQDPTLTPDQIRNALESTAEDLGNPGRDDTYGWGLIDAQAALQSIAPPAFACMVRGFDNRSYYRIHNSSSDSWDSWNALPGATYDSPGAALLGNDLHNVVRGMDGNTLWHGYLTDPADPESFSGWTRLNGATPSAPTLTR